MTETKVESASSGLGRIVRFGVIGVLNNAAGYGLFVVLSLVGVGHITAMTASYLLGMVISFWGNRAWTFGHRGAVGVTILRFLVANAVGYAVNYVALSALVVGAGVPQIPAQLVSTALVAVCTFSMMRFWVFNTRTRTARV